MSENKRYYWLKLKDDFFASKEMKKLRSIAGGDTYTIIYLKLQLLSLKDEGSLFFEGVGEDFADELSFVLDEEPDNIKVTMQFLEKCGLLKFVSDNEIVMTRVPELIGSETNKAAYMRKLRGNNVTRLLPDCYPSVTQDINIDKEKERISLTGYKKESGEKMPNYQTFVDLYHQLCPSLPKIQKLTETRKTNIKARWLEYPDIETFKRVFEKCENNAFMKGNNDRGWIANIDFILQASSFTKIVEGFYDRMGETAKPTEQKPNSSFKAEDFFKKAVKRSEGSK